MKPSYVRGIALSIEPLGRDEYQDNGRFRFYTRLMPSPTRPAGTALTARDCAARCHPLRKGPAALGATVVNPAGEGSRVQHGASFTRVLGKPYPASTVRGRPNQGFHSHLCGLGLEALNLGLSQAENPGPAAALGAALVHAYLAGRSRTQASSEVRRHNPSPHHRLKNLFENDQSLSEGPPSAGGDT